MLGLKGCWKVFRERRGVAECATRAPGRSSGRPWGSWPGVPRRLGRPEGGGRPDRRRQGRRSERAARGSAGGRYELGLEGRRAGEEAAARRRT